MGRSCQALEQPVDQLALRRDQLLPGGGGTKPLRPIDLRELLLIAGARRPLHREADALEFLRIEFGLRGPGVDDLAALTDRAQLGQVAGGQLRRRPELLAELAQCGLDQLLAGVGFSLGDRPGTEVFLRPEGAARVDQQDLGLTGGEPVEEDAGAFLDP